MRLCGPIWRVASITYYAQWDFVVLDYDSSEYLNSLPLEDVGRRFLAVVCEYVVCEYVVSTK
jgi:hypothetical protein